MHEQGELNPRQLKSKFNHIQFKNIKQIFKYVVGNNQKRLGMKQ